MEEKATAVSKWNLFKEILLSDDKAKLEKVSEILLSAEEENVQLEMVNSVDGSVTFEAENWNAGTPVFIVNPDGNVPVPAGDYELETGQILVVMEDGVIAEVKEAPAEPEQEMSDETPSSQPAQPTMAEQIAKRTVESTTTSKETYFSKEDMNAKDEEILALKAELEALKNKETESVELSATEEDPKPIIHNPESKQTELKPVKLGRSIEDNVKALMYR